MNMPARFGKSLTLVELALAVSLLLVGCYAATTGHFTRHMLLHVGLMTILAPLLASWLLRRGWRCSGVDRARFLVWITLAQLLLFFLWHLPRTMVWMASSPLLHILMQISLLLVALGFWSSVLQQTGSHTWRAIVALLLTGKLFCLVAIILVFAPRALYGAMGGHGLIELADQQLAGLLMITACPLTYVLAAVLLVTRWLRGMDEPAESRP